MKNNCLFFVLITCVLIHVFIIKMLRVKNTKSTLIKLHKVDKFCMTENAERTKKNRNYEIIIMIHTVCS